VVAGDAGAAVSMMSDVLKPYFLLACVAFFVGFASYLVMQRTVSAAAPANFEATAPISASAPPVEASLARLHSI
jgi:drug/metabolite transporter (DMT)-like permease